MKRFFLFAMVCLTAVSALFAEVVEVHNVGELVSAVNKNASAYIQLMNDINISSLTQPIDKTFKGTIDGRGVDDEGNEVAYCIGGVAKTGSKETRATSMLFTATDGAKFENVVFAHYRLESDDDNLGVVAGTMNNTMFYQVGIVGVSVFDDDDYAGTLAGEATNCIFNCVRIIGCDVTVDGDHVGGLVGISTESEFTECSVSLDTRIFADGSGIDAYAGGLVGEAVGGKFDRCVSLGMVGGNDDRVGGLVGYSEDTRYTSCTNSGFVCQTTEEEFKKAVDQLVTSLQDDIDTYYTIMEVSRWLMVGFVVALAGWPLVGLGPIYAGVAFVVGFGMIVSGLALMLTTAWMGHDEVGGIVGSVTGGSFDYCSNYGCCYGIDESVGGITGKTCHTFTTGGGATFNNCLNAGTVHGRIDVGGIVGRMEESYVKNCLNTGEVIAENGACGGAIFGTQDLCGWNNNYFRGNRYDKESGGRISVTDEQLSSGIVAWWLNEGQTNGPWRQNIGGDNVDKWPTLDPTHRQVTEQDLANRFEISTAADLVAFATQVNSADGTYVAYLTNDIDMKGVNWTPIGTKTHPFVGLFNGGGHTIDNLTYNATTSDAGLFGTLGLRAEIRDVTLGEHSAITSTANAVGGIAGCVRVSDKNTGTVKFINCGNNAPIKGSYNVGGILGAVYFDTQLILEMTDCFNQGLITATTKGETGTGESAAICGFAKNHATLTRCWNTGDVVGLTSSGSKFQGYVSNAFMAYGGSEPTLINCYNLESLNSGSRSQKGVNPFAAWKLANGDLTYMLNQQNNTSDPDHIYWQQNIDGSQAYPIPGKKGLFYTREIAPKAGATDYLATICLPYDVASTDDQKYYVLEDGTDVDVLSFKSVDVLPARTPAIVRTKEAGTLEFVSVGERVEFSDTYVVTPDNSHWSMAGTLRDVFTCTDPHDLSMLYYISNGVIRYATKSLTVNPFRAYFWGPENNQSNAISLRFDGENTTAIEWTACSDNANANANIYNPQGQQVSEGYKGIVIKDGKKYLNR